MGTPLWGGSTTAAADTPPRGRPAGRAHGANMSHGARPHSGHLTSTNQRTPITRTHAHAPHDRYLSRPRLVRMPLTRRRRILSSSVYHIIIIQDVPKSNKIYYTKFNTNFNWSNIFLDNLTGRLRRAITMMIYRIFFVFNLLKITGKFYPRIMFFGKPSQTFLYLDEIDKSTRHDFQEINSKISIYLHIRDIVNDE